MRLGLAIVLISFAISSHGADTLSIIKGRVYDAATNEILIGASINFGENKGVITDEKGEYSFPVRLRKLNVTVRYIGYKTELIHITIQPGETLVLNFALEREINEIDQIVVSASKSEQKLSDLTVSMSLIKPYTLSENHITDPQELINKTPGIEVLDGQAAIRGGSGFSYGAGSRVLALIDGLPVISADAGNIKWQFLPLENLSQIEIIKGASSVLYGSSALNGVINFRSAAATESPKTRFFLESGLFDKPRDHRRVWWDSPRIFSNISFSHARKLGNNDFSIGAAGIFDNGYRRLNDEKLGRMSLMLKHYDQKISGLNYGLNLNAGKTIKTDFVLWENADQGALKQSESTANELAGSFVTVDPFVTYKSGNSEQELKMRLQKTSNRFEEAAQNNSEALSFYSEYQFKHKIKQFADLNFGLSENYSRIESNFYDNHHSLNLAAYLQAGFEPVKRLKIISGIRVEQYSLDGFAEKIVPIFRSGINYQLSNYSFLRASFGQGYRYPSIAEKFASTTIGSVRIFPNPEIGAEKGWNSEIGIKQAILLGKISGMADLALFYSRNTNMIEYVFGLYPDLSTGNFELGFQATNIEHSRVYGIESEISLNFITGKFNNTIHVGYIFMNPVEFNPVSNKNTGEYLKYRRKNSAQLSVHSKYGKFEGGLSFYFRSKTLSIDQVFLSELSRETILPGFYDYWPEINKAYIVADLMLGYSLSNAYKISLAIKNINNKEFMGRPGDMQPQRNLSLRISRLF